jgi:chromosome segregation ATPase
MAVPAESEAGHEAYDFDRLEAAVSVLAESHGRLRREAAELRRQIDQRNRRVRTLETELLASNQRRQDAVKRIDELISHLDQLDAELDEVQSHADAGVLTK